MTKPAGLLLFLSIVFISGIHGFLLQACFSLLLLLLLLLTALPVSRVLFTNRTHALIFAFPIGYIVHAVFLSLLGIAFGIRVSTFVVYLIVWLLAAFLSERRYSMAGRDARPTETDPKWNGNDTLMLFGWLLLITAVLALPFLHVGMETPQGFAYRAYFNGDFFRHMAVTANLSHQGIPPDNPYFSGVVLHYYWFFHIIPAYWMKLFPSYSLDSLMVQFNLAVGLMFVASLFAAVRHYTELRKSAVFLFPLFLLGGSYEGLFVIYRIHRESLPWMAFTSWNVDAILRWWWNEPQVDTLFRALLYDPQHLIGLCVFLIVVMLWKPAGSFPAKRILLYSLLFSAVGFTVILAAVLILGCGMLALIEAFRDLRKKWLQLTASAFLGIGFLLVYLYVFQMFGTERGDIRFELNDLVLKHVFGFFFLNWGAVLIVGLAGILWGSKRLPLRILTFYLILCIVFIFLVNLEAPGLSEITLKMGFLSYVILLLLSAGLFDRLLKTIRPVRLAVGLAILLFPAIVTWLMDFYNNQDVRNTKFTTYVSTEEAALFRWMSRNLEGNATVQNYSLAREGYVGEYVTEIPPVSQRAVYLGDKIHSRVYQISQNQMDRREKVVWRLFHLNSPGQISVVAQKAGIEYLFLGSKDTLYKFEAHLTEPFFTPARKEGNARLFRVNQREVSLEDLETKVLLQDEKGMPVLQLDYGKNFYKPQVYRKMETARWMSNDGLIRFRSKGVFKGTLNMTVSAFHEERKMQVFLNDQPVAQKAIPERMIKIALDVQFPSGENVLRLHCPDGASPANQAGHEGDRRLLSFCITDVRFTPL